LLHWLDQLALEDAPVVVIGTEIECLLEDLLQEVIQHLPFTIIQNYELDRAALVLDPDRVDAFAAWLRRAGSGDVMIVRTQAPGCGVSTMLRVVAAELDVELIEVAPGAQKTKAFLTDASAAKVTVDMRKKVLVFDPMDTLLSDQTTAVDVLEFLRHRSKVPVVCSGFLQRSSLAKVSDALGKATVVTTLTFPKIDDARAVTRLQTIAAREHKACDVRAAWEASRGDFRAALASVRMDLANSVKDSVCDGVDAIHTALYSSDLSLREAMHLQDGDVNMVSMGVFENYPLVLTQDIEACATVADDYSCADVVDEYMYNSQAWELSGAYAALTTGAAALHIRPTKKIEITKFGSVWSRSNNQRSKEKQAVAVVHQMTEARGNRVPVEDLAYVRVMIRTMCDAQRFEEAADLARGCGLNAAAVLSVMRLFKTKYSQAEHSRIKKLLAAANSQI